jgi:hypothetical protein
VFFYVIAGFGDSHVVYTAGADVWARDLVSGSWSDPVHIATGTHPIHPNLAVDAAGTLYLTWFDNLSGGTAPTILYAQRVGGTWSGSEVVADASDALGVLANNNLDQGPSIVVTTDGTPTVIYMSSPQTTSGGASFGVIQIKRLVAGVWTLDPTVSTNPIYAHTPQIYSHGNDLYAFLGHDIQIRFGYIYQLANRN